MLTPCQDVILGAVIRKAITWFFSWFSIMNAVKSSGALKQKMFFTAYNSKKQALMSGKKMHATSFLTVVWFSLLMILSLL